MPAFESRRKAGASLSCSRICGNKVSGSAVGTTAKPLSIAVRLSCGLAGTGSFRLALCARASVPTPAAAIIPMIAARLRCCLMMLPRARGSAEDQVLGEAGLAGLLVLGVHVLAGVGQGLDRGVEVDPVTRGDLVGRDHDRRPRLHGAERATLDARHLDVAGDGIAGHAE